MNLRRKIIPYSASTLLLLGSLGACSQAQRTPTPHLTPPQILYISETDLGLPPYKGPQDFEEFTYLAMAIEAMKRLPKEDYQNLVKETVKGKLLEVVGKSLTDGVSLTFVDTGDVWYTFKVTHDWLPPPIGRINEIDKNKAKELSDKRNAMLREWETKLDRIEIR